MPRVRLDTLLAQRGLYESRSRAAASVMAGEVFVGAGRDRASKPGQLVAEDITVDVSQPPRYVSRGGLKLEHALDALDLPVHDRLALDVGASTGGFTDCLLQRDVRRVCAVDVAYGELHWTLRSDDRVDVVERVNARSLTPADIPFVPSLAVCDVSFISLTKVLPAVLATLDHDRFDVLAMIKPQFEVGRARVGKGGVVRSPEDRRAALERVATSVAPAAGVLGFASSGLPGPKGNRETFVHLAEPSRRGVLDPAGIARAAAVAEPFDE